MLGDEVWDAVGARCHNNVKTRACDKTVGIKYKPASFHILLHAGSCLDTLDTVKGNCNTAAKQ